MKKYDSLLTKVELFHRLAMYGDRKAFLQALAQDQAGVSNQLSVAAQQFLNDIQGRWDQVKFKTNITMPFMRLQSLLNRAKDTGDSRSLQQVPGLMDQLLSAVQSENVMPEAMDALHQLRESAGIAANQMGNAAPAGGGAAAPAGETAEDRYKSLVQKYQDTSAPAAKPQGPAYDKPTITLLQTFLNQMSQGGAGQATMAPITVDGKFGPETMKALQHWGTVNKIPSKDVSQLLQMAISKSKA